MINKLIKFFLQNRLITALLIVGILLGGIIVSPFGWKIDGIPASPLGVDALPNIGENQQIVFTEWEGHSPEDVENQITYPLTTALLGLPGVKDIRSSSMQDFSSIAIIFDDNVEFYWARSRILEKLNALPQGLLPDGIKPTLGPDATGLGQVFWYTLEGRDPEGNPTGGWDLHDIRSVQDFYVKYALNAVQGVSEIASIGGNVREYQVDVDPSALRKYDIAIEDVAKTLQQSNRDVGAKTIEINQVEYLIRGLGYITNIEDIESAVIKEVNQVPVRLDQVANVRLGPAPKRGTLDKDGAEVVGGVVTSRFDANAIEVIANVKEKIEEVQKGMPTKTLKDGTQSQLTIVPFYDRSELIAETLNTLNDAISLQVLITMLVIIVMVYNLRASIAISLLLPFAILMAFMGMKAFNIDANIVSLSGIAIAIGTMVDLGIILSENVIKKKDEHPRWPLVKQIYEGAQEVSSAILTAVATTVVSFLPVFTLQSTEGKLFVSLAFTKTFALIAALLVAMFVLPTLLSWFFGIKAKTKKIKIWIYSALLLIAITGLFNAVIVPALLLIVFIGLLILKEIYQPRFKNDWKRWVWQHLELLIVLLVVCGYLSSYWMPLGLAKSFGINFLFVFLLATLILSFFLSIQFSYTRILCWCLAHKKIFLSIPVVLVGFGIVVWIGFSTVFGVVERGFDKVGYDLNKTKIWSALSHTFPGIGHEFMPALDEGSFLLMPTTMPHSGVEYNQKKLAQLDRRVSSIPEVEMTVGKMGRAETALDPAPISMFENIINYKDEFTLVEGKLLRYKTDKEGRFITRSGDTLSNDEALQRQIDITLLIPDKKGKPFRNWRSWIKSPDDIWVEIAEVAELPGLTNAPKLQPIETRNLMLQTGMNAPMGVKIHGTNLEEIESFGKAVGELIKEVSGVKKAAVFAQRVIGKPYLLLHIERDRLGRYGLTVDDVQRTIETAVGGIIATQTVEGRERYNVRVRYPRELRDSPDELGDILITNSKGLQVSLSDVVTISYESGPQEIYSENTFLTSTVLFDKEEGFAETEVAHNVLQTLERNQKNGKLVRPDGVTYELAGNYQNQLRAVKRLSFIIPIVLIVVFLILYFQFRSTITALIVFSSITLAMSGGFILLWFYGQDWFMNFDLFGVSMQTLFQIHPVNLSVAVWVGFIALFGLATDDGVLMATYLDQSFASNQPKTLSEVREMVIVGAEKRIRPAVMTAATTVIALLPVLTSSGRGADIMIPMAIPAFGGMILTCITFYVVPVLYGMRKEQVFKKLEK